jgi:transposase-like protein
MKCPKCSREMALAEKHTFTGEDIREYYCESCRESVVENRGTALWKMLSDANEEAEQKRKK